MPSNKNPYTEKTQQNREEELIKYAPLVKRVVTRMAARFPPGVDSDEFGPMMASIVTITVPLVVAFIIAQKRFIEGITMTGMK